MKKVVFVIDSLCSGGAQKQLVETANAMVWNGMVVSVVCYHFDDHFRADLDSRVDLIFLKKSSGFDLRLIFSLRRVVKKLNPQIVYSYLNIPSVYARFALIGLRSRSKLIVGIRNMDTVQERKWIGLERYTGWCVNHYITNSSYVKEQFEKKGMACPSKVSVVYNGVNLNHLPESVVLSDVSCVALVGRVVPGKGHSILIEAARVLREEGLLLNIEFIGAIRNQSYKNDLVKKIEACGLNNAVTFVGEVSDIYRQLKHVSCVVLPSLMEGFPNVLLEAMVAGLPVIASDISDNRLIVDEGETGFLFASSDVAELVSALRKYLLMDSELRHAMGRKARVKIIRNFSIDNTLRDTLSVFDRVLRET